MIRCPNCHEALKKGSNEYYCSNNHHFDIAKSGYVNLLLNQSQSGDNKLMVNARKTFLNNGYFKPLLDQLIGILKTHTVSNLLDLGCGEGYYSRNIKDALDIDVYGVDISKDAINVAAKQSINLNYIVSNIYNLPFSDESFDAIINIFAPHSPEINRVSKGVYIKVVPGPKHLIELKESLYKDVYIKEEDELDFVGMNKIGEHQLLYEGYVEHINELLMMTPYYYKTNLNDIILKPMDVTMDFKILVYHK